MTECGLWSNRWPTEPGVYWFYGCVYKGNTTQMHICEVNQTRMGPVYVVGGLIMYQSEGAKGLWKLIPKPSVPSTEF